MSSYLEGQETGEEEEDDRAEHDHDLPPAPGHRGGLLPLARPRPRPVVLARAARVRRHLHCRVSITRLTKIILNLDRGGEVAGDDGVEEDEDQQRHPEEEADDREEEGLDPGRVHVRVALRVVGVRVLGQG